MKEMTLTGYMIQYDAWVNAIRASGGTQLMQDMVIARARRIRTPDGLLDSWQLGLVVGELQNHLTPLELADWRKTTAAGSDLDRVPFVRTPQGPVS